MFHLYMVPSCISCRKTRKWLEDYHLEYHLHHLLYDPLLGCEIKHILYLLEGKHKNKFYKKESVSFHIKSPVPLSVLEGNRAFYLFLWNDQVTQEPPVSYGFRSGAYKGIRAHGTRLQTYNQEETSQMPKGCLLQMGKRKRETNLLARSHFFLVGKKSFFLLFQQKPYRFFRNHCSCDRSLKE